MKHRNLVTKGSIYTALCPVNGQVFLYEFDPITETLTAINAPIPVPVNNVFKLDIQAPNKDVYLLLRWGDFFDVIRVGEPDIIVFLTSTDPSITYNYSHVKIDGTEISSGTFIPLSNGFFYHKPLSLEFSYFIVNGTGLSVLDVPYNVITVSGGGNNQLVINGNFIDVGYAEFGYLGERNAYFDLNLGQWISDNTRIAKAEDLAKAVAFKYNLNFYDRTASNWIGNYIAYLRTYDEEAKQFRLYVPSITPENNVNNFELYSTDEFGNPFLRGVSILIKSGIEQTNDGSIGLIVPYR